MPQAAQASIEWIHLDTAAPDALQVGDVVSADAGGLPTYRVVAVAGPDVWLRDEAHAAVRLARVSGLHWKMAGAPAPALADR